MVQISGKKILLRSVLLSDAGRLYKWENDKSHWDASGTKKKFTIKEIKDFIANQKDIYLDKQLRLMICLSPQSIAGCIDLFKFNIRSRSAGIGILIDKKYRKKGYGSEALSLLISYSFEILNLKQLYCNISKNNIASMNLFRKNKFILTENKKGMNTLILTKQ